MTDAFPTDDEREFGYVMAKLTLGAVPGVGPAAQELLEKAVGNPLRRRQEAWFASLAAALEDLAAKVEGFDPEVLAQDEVFVSTVARATQLALATHGQTRREALRNIVLNTAGQVRLDEAMLGTFLSYVERFSEAHLKLLTLLGDPMADPGYARKARSISLGGSVHGLIQSVHPDLAQSEELLDRLHEDLLREGLVNKGFKDMTSADGLQSPKVTAAGAAFLNFIRQPQT